MTELREQLEALARRGSERGAIDVIDAARRAAGVGSEGGDIPVADDDDLAMVEPIALSEAASRKRRNTFQRTIALAGVAALVGVSAMAISALNGGGGASSPEAAVRDLADAISHEDMLGAVNVLAPEEVRSLASSLDAMSAKAAEHDLVDQASAPLEGIDFSIDNLELETEDLAPGYAKVYIHGGTASVKVDPKALSDLVQDAGAADAEPVNESADLRELADDATEPFLMAVKHDGSWFVSPAYTGLEYMRVENDLPPASFGSGKAQAAQLGAESPKAAVEGGLNAISEQDWDALLALAPPGEIPVYDYRAAIGALIDEEEQESSNGITVDNFEASEAIDGDDAVVTVTAASGRYRDGGGSWSLDNGCVVSDESSQDDYESTVCVSDANALFAVAGTGEARTDAEPLEVHAVRRDGRWFVSPVATLLDRIDTWIADLDSRTIYTLTGQYDRIEPDGVLVLGEQTVVPTGGWANQHVYTFSGTEGQKLLGESVYMGPQSEDDYVEASMRLFGPGNDEVEGEYLDYQGVTLPKTGEYRLVVGTPGDREVGITVWNYDDAPADRRARYDYEFEDDFSDDGCVTYADGSTACSSTGAASSSGSSNSGLSEAEQQLLQGDGMPVVPTTVGVTGE